MNYTGHVLQTIFIGIGATMLMDAWGLLMKSVGVKGLNMAHLGRWILTLPKGKWFHAGISNSPELRGELVVGWMAHYTIGISIALLLVAVYGFSWVEKPTLRAAITIGLITVLAPLLILQPALGLGYFASKSANPAVSVLRSLGSHLIFGLGLYLSAISLNRLWESIMNP